MSDAYVVIKSAIDKELEAGGNDRGVGVAFGLDLYREFAKRSWITLEDPKAVGFPPLWPFYNKVHAAYADWRLDDLNYEVGKRNA